MSTYSAHRQLNIWLPAVQTGTGSDVYTLRLADALRSAGHNPTIQFFNRRFEFAPGLLKRIPSPPGTHIIHANSWNAYAFKRAGIPLVVTEHHYINDPAFKPYRTRLQALYHALHVLPCVHRSYAQADAVIAVSQHTALAIKQQHGIKAHWIPNWVDIEVFKPTPIGTRPSGPMRCLFVGNPSRRKGSDLLPRLAHLLPDDIQIHYLGGLRTQSDSHTTRLVAVPRQPPELMPSLYQRMDVALVPTRYEAFGYVALEAMACGLPVVGFDSTGTAEICRNGETALLGPVEDLDTLTDNLIRLRDDTRLRSQLGRNGRTHAEANFSAAVTLPAYLDAYARVLR